MSKQAEERLAAVVEMIGRTGASQFSLRYQDDEQPTVWVCIAKWGETFEATGAMTPLVAAMRLLEQVVDGGQCKHCGRPTGASDDFTQMPLDTLVCWYQYDPELKKFRRGCEGS